MPTSSLQTLLPANYASVAAGGFVFLLAFLFGSYITWRALLSVKWEKFLFDPFGNNTRLLRFLLGLMGGLVFALASVGIFIALRALQLMF